MTKQAKQNCPLDPKGRFACKEHPSKAHPPNNETADDFYSHLRLEFGVNDGDFKI